MNDLSDGVLTWQSNEGDTGSFTIVFSAADYADTTETAVSVIIGDVNARPRLAVEG